MIRVGGGEKERKKERKEKKPFNGFDVKFFGLGRGGGN